MNNRIKELSEQATEPPVFPANIGYFNKEKFAELIVKECVDIVEGRGFLHEQAPDAIFARECSSVIKRHFGINNAQ